MNDEKPVSMCDADTCADGLGGADEKGASSTKVRHRRTGMKESGVEWLGKIPAHWELKRLKHLCSVFPSNVDKHSIEGEVPVRLCNYTDVYYQDLITGNLPFMEATATPAEIRKFTLRRGDVIFTKDSEAADDIAVAALVADDLPGVLCGYHLTVARSRPGTSGAFIKWFFDSNYARARFEVSANGLTRYSLGQYASENIELPAPPPSEQRIIAAYLDRETKQIDRLIERLERLITLLEEKRQAAISHAVTKGLNPGVPMKDSEIEWLGQVPEHWTVTPLMWLTQPRRPIMYGIVLPGPNVPEGVLIVKGGDVKPGRLDPDRLNKTTHEIEASYARSRLRGGDLVYSIRGGIGDVEIVPESISGANLTQDAARIAPSPDLNTYWLLCALRSRPVFAQLEAGALGAAVRGINIRDLKRAMIPVPPREEQDAIADHLFRLDDETEAAVEDAAQMIARLRERRSALISAAVTGQIDLSEMTKDAEAMA